MELNYGNVTKLGYELMEFFNRVGNYQEKKAVLNNLPINVLKAIPNSSLLIEGGEIKYISVHGVKE